MGGGVEFMKASVIGFSASERDVFMHEHGAGAAC